MKVCICAHSSFNVPNHRLFFLSKELIKRGVDLTFVLPGKSDSEACRERFKEARVLDAGMNVSRFKSSKLWLYPIFVIRAGRIIKEDFDFVYGICLPAALATCFSRSKSKKVVDYLDFWSKYWLYSDSSLKGRVVHFLVRAAEAYTVKKADMVLTITKKMAEQLREIGCKKSKIRVIRDGVDTKKFYEFEVKDSFYKKYGLDKNIDYVAFQGGIAAHDGVQFLVEAAPLVLKEHPKVKFLIVGAGTYLKTIKEMVSKAGLDKSFVYTGWVDYKEMPLFMNLARINCVPLPDSPATHGVVTYKLFEAMACGTPSVMGNMPAVRATAKHMDSAYLVKSEDKENLAKGINKLLSDKKLYGQIKQNGLKLAKKHEWRDIARDMADVLEV